MQPSNIHKLILNNAIFITVNQARLRGGAGGAKAPFLNAMICFLIANMIQRRSSKLKANNL